MILQEIRQVVQSLNEKFIGRNQLVNLLMSQVKSLNKLILVEASNIDQNNEPCQVNNFVSKYLKFSDKADEVSEQFKQQNIYNKKKRQIIDDFVDKFLIPDENFSNQISVDLMKNILQTPRKLTFMSENIVQEEEKYYVQRIANLEIANIYKAAAKLMKQQETDANCQESLTEVFQSENLNFEKEKQKCKLQKEENAPMKFNINASNETTFVQAPV